MTRKTMTCPVLVKTEGAGLEDGQFEALVSVFGNVDSMGERVVKGAFAKTLEEWEASGDPIPVIWSHRWSDPEYHVGVVLAAEERDEGLWVRGQLDVDEAKAAKVHRLLKGRRVTQFSFAYDVIDSRKADGCWELTELKLFEVGPTLVGANQETELLAAKDGKTGRVLSAKNEETLKSADSMIKEGLALIQSVLSQLADTASADDDSKASSSGPATDPAHDAPTPSSPVALRVATQLALEAPTP